MFNFEDSERNLEKGKTRKKGSLTEVRGNRKEDAVEGGIDDWGEVVTR